jgi:hypothetical protein
MKFFRTFLIVGFMGCVFTAKAQPTDLGTVEVKVTNSYKAKVGEAVKYNEQPRFEDTTTSKIPVNYKIVSQPIEVKYKPEPISAARIVQVPVEKLSQGMVKGGFGLYGTPFIEGYWNSKRSSTESYGFWGKHYSTKTGVKETIYESNGLSQNSLGGYYNHFYRNMTWESKLYGKWDKYTYYGVDDFTDSLDYVRDQPRDADYNWYRQYGVSTSLTGKKQKDMGWLDKAGLDYYNFSDRYKSNENFIGIASAWELPAGEQQLDLDLNVSYFQTNFDTLAKGRQSYFTVQARPNVELTKNDILFDFGLNIYSNSYNSELTGGEYKLHFFPEINLQFPFVKDVLSIYGGVKGQLQQNSYRQLTLKNPYINPGDTLRPTRTTDIYVGLVGILSSTTSFNIKGGLMLQRDLALFYRNPFYRNLVDSAVFHGLDVRYDNSETFYARGELASNINDNLQVSLFGEVRSYSTNKEEKAWHLPSFLAGLDVDYTLREKIKLGTEWNYVGKRQAFIQAQNPEVESTLPGYMDVAMDVEYLYNSHLSAFVSVSNLLNNKYDMYLGYKAQSINFLMGFNYKF